ncbi:MAG: hypothetical protein WCI05_08410 [Myxococcales bacterium]
MPRQSVPPFKPGSLRDALAAFHNLLTLLRSSRVTLAVIVDLLPELDASVAALAWAFAEAGDPSHNVSPDLDRFAIGALSEFEKALEGVRVASTDRVALHDRLAVTRDNIVVAVELLELLQRASHPRLTEVSLGGLVREAVLLAGSTRVGDRTATFECVSDGLVITDPCTVARILAISASDLPSSGVVRCGWTATHGTVRLEAHCGAAEGIRLRIPQARAVGPSPAVAEAAALAIGGSIDRDHNGVCIRIPRAAFSSSSG